MRSSWIRFFTPLVIALTLNPTLAAAKDCSACDAYAGGTVGGHGDQGNANNAVNMAFINKICGTPLTSGTGAIAPGAGTGSVFAGKQGTGTATTPDQTKLTDQGVDPNSNSGDPVWDACKNGIVGTEQGFGDKNAWLQLGTYCSARTMADTATDGERTAAIWYTVAAGTCTAACALEAFKWTGVTQAANLACAGAGIVAAGVDLDYDSNLHGEYRTTMNAVGRDLGLAADGAAFFGGFTSFGAKMAPRSTGGAIIACAIAASMIAVASIRWAAIGQDADSRDKNCDSATSLISQITPAPAGGGTTTSSDGNVSSVSSNLTGSSTGSGSTSSGGSGSKSGGSAYSAHMQDFFNHPFDPKFAAATSGPIAPILRGMTPDLKKMLDSQNATVKDIADRLQRQSPANVAAALAGSVPPELSAGLAQVEKDALGGKTVIPGNPMGSAMVAGNAGGKGGAAGAAKPNPFMFGMKGPGEGGAPTETTFEKMKRELASSDANGDIWHEGYGGTIFQIISGKLVQTHDRIDQLEWDTPLNRALVGLPARKAQTGH